MKMVAASGAEIPSLGFGTHGMSREHILRTIPAALSAGFRHIDTAQIYRNEEAVGECVQASGLDRADVFVTTKVWVASYAKGAFAASVDDSLRKLRTDYIDLLLLHWPHPNVPLGEQIAGLNAAVEAGHVRHIGVSNFTRQLLAEAVRISEAPIVTNQFEYHPYLNQRLLIDECRRLGVSVTAYCGMAVGQVFDDPVLLEIADRRAKTVAQIVLRWLIQQDGVVALTRTTNPARIPANLNVFGFELNPDDMRAISHLATSDGRIVNPTGLAPAWDPTPALAAQFASAPREDLPCETDLLERFE